jgi:hypothetical protein
MYTYAMETVGQVKSDILPLLDLHYDELTLNKDVMKLAPDWAKYQALEDNNQLLAFTVRHGGVLVGYSVWFTDVHIHYAGSLTAHNDVIFLHRDFRKGTTVGRELIDFSEKMLKAFGVDKCYWHIKFKQDWSAILLRRGYQREDMIVGKAL